MALMKTPLVDTDSRDGGSQADVLHDDNTGSLHMLLDVVVHGGGMRKLALIELRQVCAAAVEPLSIFFLKPPSPTTLSAHKILASFFAPLGAVKRFPAFHRRWVSRN